MKFTFEDTWEEALDSLAASIKGGEAEGWELALVRRRMQAALAESAKEIERLEADIGGLEDLLRLERDKNTRILRESDAEIERLKRVNEWQPIETAPKDGKEVIATDGRDVFTARYRISNCTQDAPFFAVSGDGEFINRGTDWNFEPDYRWPTHWMPLPTPPNTKKEG
jgi:hypothetical protein